MNKNHMTFRKVFSNVIAYMLVILVFVTIVFFLPEEEVEMDFSRTTTAILLYSLWVVISIISILINYLIYRSEYYYFSETAINYEMTFFIKKQVILPYEKINIVNIKRSLVDRIFGISKIKLGSGNATTFSKEEIVITLNKEDAIILANKIEEITNKVKNDELIDFDNIDGNVIETKEKKKIIKASTIFKQCFLTEGLICSTLFLTIFSIIPASFYKHYYVIPIVFIAFYLIAGLFIFLIYIIVYGNFSIERKNDNIKISYGLINLKSHLIPIAKTHGIELTQSILQKRLKLGSLKIAVVGLTMSENNQNGNVQVLACAIPVGNVDAINKVIDEMLPEYKVEDIEFNIKKPVKKSLKHYLLLPNIIALIAISPLIMLSIHFLGLYTLCILPFYLFFNVLVYLSYRHTTIAVNDKFSKITFGGIFRKEIICHTKSILEVNKIAGCIRRKENIATIRINLRGYPGLFVIRNVYDFDVSEYN